VFGSHICKGSVQIKGLRLCPHNENRFDQTLPESHFRGSRTNLK